jgi:hypothetical protein
MKGRGIVNTTGKTRSTNFSQKNVEPSDLISQAQMIAKDEIQEHYDGVEMFYWEGAECSVSAVIIGTVRLQLVPEDMVPIECAPEDFEEETIQYQVNMEYDHDEREWKGTVKMK